MVFYIETFGSNPFLPQGLSSFTDMQKSFFLFLHDVNNKAKRFTKQQRSNVINALACVHCYFLTAELNG